MDFFEVYKGQISLLSYFKVTISFYRFVYFVAMNCVTLILFLFYGSAI